MDTVNFFLVPALWFYIGWTWKGIIERKKLAKAMRIYTDILKAQDKNR